MSQVTDGAAWRFCMSSYRKSSCQPEVCCSSVLWLDETISEWIKDGVWQDEATKQMLLQIRPAILSLNLNKWQHEVASSWIKHLFDSLSHTNTHTHKCACTHTLCNDLEYLSSHSCWAVKPISGFAVIVSPCRRLLAFLLLIRNVAVMPRILITPVIVCSCWDNLMRCSN